MGLEQPERNGVKESTGRLHHVASLLRSNSKLKNSTASAPPTRQNGEVACRGRLSGAGALQLPVNRPIGANIKLRGLPVFRHTSSSPCVDRRLTFLSWTLKTELKLPLLARLGNSQPPDLQAGCFGRQSLEEATAQQKDLVFPGPTSSEPPVAARLGTSVGVVSCSSTLPIGSQLATTFTSPVIGPGLTLVQPGNLVLFLIRLCSQPSYPGYATRWVSIFIHMRFGSSMSLFTATELSRFDFPCPWTRLSNVWSTHATMILLYDYMKLASIPFFVHSFITFRY